MLLKLSIKNKKGFIDGTLTELEISDFEMMNQWWSKNDMVIS